MFILSNIFETGSFDQHKLISTVTESESFKGSQQKNVYISYRSFYFETFKKNDK